MTSRIAVLIIAVCCIALFTTLQQWPSDQANAQGSPVTWLVSVSSEGTPAFGGSNPTISGNGRFIAFESHSNNLVPNDTNGDTDIFVHDRQAGETTRISVASDGTQANSHSIRPDITDDGRFIAFCSSATNLIPGDTNRYAVYVHDRQIGETIPADVAIDGGSRNGTMGPKISISNDGRLVTFSSTATNLVPADTNDKSDVFVRDLQAGETTLVSVATDGTQGNDWSWNAVIADNGRFVAFHSDATNLVPNDTNGFKDVFVRDLQTEETTRISIASNSTQGNSHSFLLDISNDGRFVMFWSWASNLVPNDTNNAIDFFVHDRQTGETRRISVASDGTQAIVPTPTPRTPAIRAGSDTSQTNSPSAFSMMTEEQRYFVFDSTAANLISDDTNEKEDVFVHNLETGETTRVSVAWDGTQANDHSIHGSISDDGRYVAFLSWASLDFNYPDAGGVYIHDRSVPPPIDFAAISGQVTDSMGSPISNIMAVAYRLDSTWFPVARGYTTTSGNYTIKKLRAGTYRVQFVDLNGAYYSQYYNNKSTLEEADSFATTLDNTTENINASLVEIPPPPIRIDEGCGRVDISDTGLIFLVFPPFCSGTTEINATVTCENGSTPTNVTFWLNTQSFPMTAVDDTSYNVTLTVPDDLPDGDIAVKVTTQCGSKVETPIEGEVGLYDPSGVVTDAQTRQPIPGAIVNLFAVPETLPDVGSSSFGDCRTVNSRPISSGGQFGAWSGLSSAEQTTGQWVHPASLVGSTVAISPTINPQVTGPDGRYGWDVSAGCWYIEVRADGYQTLVSPLVGVPPEITDLDLSLHKNVGYLPTIIKTQ